MALIGINQAAPVSTGKESTLEKVAQALSIATGILGIPLVLSREAREREEAAYKKELRPLEKQKMQGDIDTAEAMRGLNVKNILSDIEEQDRRRRPLTDAQKEAYRSLRRELGMSDLAIENTMPSNVGLWEDIQRNDASRTMVSVSDKEEGKYRRGRDEKADKLEMQKRYIPELDQYALTADDAKAVKEGLVAEGQVVRMLDEVIALRKKHPSGTLTALEDIARARQLSTRALLKYKAMAQLGVLSKTDLELIDRIFPANPLAVSPGVAIGQDPIMASLQQLRETTPNDVTEQLRVFGLKRATKRPPGLSDEEARRFNELRAKED